MTATATTLLVAKPELEEEHAEVIRATLPLVGANVNEITQVFYRNLFSNHPSLIRDLFNRGNQAQGAQQRALAASIATFATHLVDPSLPNPVDLLSRIGHKHASLGVTEESYPVVHENLFAAIVEVLGADVVTEPVATAWDRVYWLMANTLIAFEKGLYDEVNVAPGDVFRKARVVGRVDDTDDVVAFVVESSDAEKPLPGFRPGQYVSVGVVLADGARQLRQYSLIGTPEPGHLSFAVRRVDAAGDAPAGEVSSFLHNNVQVGDEIDITVPFGDLTIDTEATTPLVLISAGIGDTPMVGILDYLAANSSPRHTVVLHADRSPSTHPLRTDMHALVTSLPNASLDVWYETEPGDARSGLLDISQVELPEGADVYICGGNGFLQAVRAQLQTAGVAEDKVHFELFSPNDWLV
ncbi:MAG: hemin transporter [Rhodococcus sp.]|nr:hemin transporter [Rhodococcus sp. (in: high G+C Gram-positive bacteria)]